MEYNVFNYGLSGVSDSDVISLLVEDKKTVDLLSGRSVLELARCSYSDFRAMGLMHGHASRLVAAFELNRRKSTAEAPVNVMSSRDAYEIMKPVISELMHEEFYIIYLNRANKVIKVWQASKGGISGTVTDIRMILKEAINLQCSSMVCAHNHPSGNLKPSNSDMAITKKLKEASELMDIKVLDSIIVTEDSYFSFADEGLI